MKNLLLAIKIISLATLGPIFVIGSLGLEIRGGILGCPYPLPFIMCHYCPTFCTFGVIRAGLFYGIISSSLLMGRSFCGFFCPGGAAQDLLFKIPTRKLSPPPMINQGMRYLGYFIALIIVLIIVEATGVWAGIPLVSKIWPWLTQHESAASVILIAVVSLALLLAVFISRPFCRYLCPLGNWFSPFNKYSLVELKYNDEKCAHCEKCSEVCSAGIEPTNPGKNSTECHRCLNCYTECNNGAFNFGLKLRRKKS